MKSTNTSWRDKLVYLFTKNGETVADVLECVPPIDSPEMATPFDAGYGGTEGCPFTCWTHKNVYFPVQYDGAEWVACVSRNPDGKPTGHIGGG